MKDLSDRRGASTQDTSAIQPSTQCKQCSASNACSFIYRCKARTRALLRTRAIQGSAGAIATFQGCLLTATACCHINEAGSTMLSHGWMLQQSRATQISASSYPPRPTSATGSSYATAGLAIART
eukprot:4058624-Amphidinium_carterae.1